MLTREEESKLLAVVPEPFESFCRVATYTGPRRGELLGIVGPRELPNGHPNGGPVDAR